MKEGGMVIKGTLIGLVITNVTGLTEWLKIDITRFMKY